MAQMSFFADRRGREISCRYCGCPLVMTKLIGPKGTVLRGVICGNYCDRICPLCGGECEFNEDNDDNKAAGRRGVIECDDCGWVANSPNRNFSSYVRRRHLQLEELAGEAAAAELAELVRLGRRCPTHTSLSLEIRRYKVAVIEGRFITTMRVRMCPICGEIGEPTDEGDWKPIPTRFLPPLDQCSSCGLPIRGDGLCGCS